MKEWLYLGAQFAAFCVEEEYEKIKEDWNKKFNIDKDNDLLFLYHLPFEDLKRLHNILISEDNIFLDKIKGVVQKNIVEFDESNDMYPFSWTHIIYKPKHMDASLYFTGGIHFVFF